MLDKKVFIGDREITQLLRKLSDLFPVPTHTGHMKNICNSSYEGSLPIFWTHTHTHAHAHTHAHTHMGVHIFTYTQTLIHKTLSIVIVMTLRTFLKDSDLVKRKEI